MEKKDHCTGIPEHWFGVYIGDCCEGHDEDCSYLRFYHCLRGKLNVLSSSIIAVGGEIGCWVFHTEWQINKMKKDNK